jgi:hypothetical protein
MKFYRSPTEFIEITDTRDKRLQDVLKRKYGYIDDFREFSDKKLLEFGKPPWNFLVFTNESTPYQENVIEKNDRTCKTLDVFTKTNTEKEQWSYYKDFLLHEKHLRYEFNGVRDQYIAMFDEVGLITMSHDGEYMVTERDGNPLDIQKMSRAQWEKLIRDLKKTGQLKE